MAALCGFARLSPAVPTRSMAALDDLDPRVRSVAAQALGIVGDAKAAGVLDAMLFGDPDGECRVYAAYARSMVGGMVTDAGYRWCLKFDPGCSPSASTCGCALTGGPEPLPESVRRAYATYDLSRMGSVRVGSPAPDFELPPVAGGPAVRLSDYRGKSDVVLVFIYGST